MCLTPRDEIDGAAWELYSALSHSKDVPFNADRLKALFYPPAIVTRNIYGAPATQTVDGLLSYLTAATNAADGIAYKEISHRTELYGSIAHRFSTFECRTPNLVRGIAAIQFLKIPGRWLIAGMLWASEPDGFPIPAEYLAPR